MSMSSRRFFDGAMVEYGLLPIEAVASNVTITAPVLAAPETLLAPSFPAVQTLVAPVISASASLQSPSTVFVVSLPVFASTATLLVPAASVKIFVPLLDSTGFYESTVLADSPTGYWKFNEGGGILSTDSSGNSYTGTLTGNAAFISTSGTWTAALDVDGTGDYSEVADTSPLRFAGADFSIEAWFYLDAVNVTNRTIVGKAPSSGGGSIEYLLRVTSANKAEFFVGQSANGNNWLSAVGATTLVAGQWYHIVGTLNEATDVATVYLNGSSDGTDSTVTGTRSTATDGLRIGDYQGTGINGKIAHVAAYPSVLSGTQVSTHFNAASPATATLLAPQVNFSIIAPVITAASTIPSPTVVIIQNVTLPLLKSGPNPDPVPSLSPQFWFDADDASTLTLEPGGLVSQWDDLSGNDLHVTQSITVYQPVTGSTIGSRNALLWDDAYMNHDAGTDALDFSPVTWFMVVDVGAAGQNTWARLWSAHESATGTYDYQSPNAAVIRQAGDSWSFDVAGVPTSPSAPYTPDTTFIVEGSANGTITSISVNGGTAYTETTATMPGNMRYLSIGMGLTSNNPPGPGDALLNSLVGELVIFNADLSTANREAVRSYLSAKWSVESPGSSGVSIHAPTVVPDQFLTAPVIDTWTPITPLALSPAVWLDASDAATITETGGDVSQWDDKSGNGMDLAQSTSAYQPRYGDDTRNGRNVLTFNTAILFNSNPITGLTMDDFTVFIVTEENTGGDYRGFLSVHSTTGNDYDRTDAFDLESANNSYLMWTALNNTYFFNSISGSGDAPLAVYTSRRSGTNGMMWKNSVNDFGGETTTATGAHTGGFLVGGRFNSGSINYSDSMMDGWICEVVVYAEALSTVDRELVENYLYDKWLGTLAETRLHAPSVAYAPSVPLLAAPATVWAPTIPSAALTLDAPVISASDSTYAPSTAFVVSLPVLATTATTYEPVLNLAITAPVIASPATLLTPSLIQQQFLVVPVLTAPATLLTPQINLTIAPTVVSAPATVLAPALTQQQFLDVPVLSTSATLLAPALGVYITVPVFGVTATLLAPQINLTITATVITAPASPLAPTLNVQQLLSPPVVAASATIYGPTVNLAISAPVITASATVISPALTQQQFLDVPVLSTTATVLAPALDATVFVPVLGASTTLLAPQVNLTLAAPVVVSTTTIEAPSLIQQQFLIAPVLAAPATTVGPQVNLTIYFPLLSAPETVLAPTAVWNQTLVASVLTASATLLVPSVALVVSVPVLDTWGGVLLTEAGDTLVTEAGEPLLLEETTGRLYPPLVALASQQLFAPVIVAQETLNAPQVNLTIFAPVLTISENLLTPSVTWQEFLIAPVLTVPDTTLAPTIATFTSLTAPLLAAQDSVHAPKLVVVLSPPVLSAPESILSPQVNLTIFVPVLSATETLNAASITTAGTLATPLIVASETIYEPVVLRLLEILEPPAIAVPTSFLAPQINLTIFAPIVSAPETMQTPAVLTSNTLTTGTISAPATLLAPAISLSVESNYVPAPATLLTPQVNLTIFASTAPVPATLFSPSVARVLQTPTISSPSALFAPTVNLTIFVPVLSVPETVLAPSLILQQFITLGTISAPATLFAPSVLPSQILSIPVLTAPATLIEPIVTSGIIPPTISAPVSLLAPNLVSVIGPPVITNPETTFSPSVTTSTTCTTPVLNSASSTLEPQVNLRSTAPVIATPSSFPVPQVNHRVYSPSISVQETLPVPSVRNVSPIYIGTVKVSTWFIGSTPREVIVGDQ